MPDTKAFARRYTAAWCSKDPHKVAAHFTDTGWLSVNDGPRATGHAAIAEVAQGFMTTFPDLEVRLEKLVETPAAARISLAPARHRERRPQGRHHRRRSLATGA